MGFFDQVPQKVFVRKPAGNHFENPLTVDLVESLSRHDYERVEAALAAGANPNDLGLVQQGSSFGFLPLHYFVGADDKDAVQWLLDHGANPALKAPYMGSPLLFAVTLDRAERLEQLLARHEVILIEKSVQQNLLFEAARRDAPRCLQLLVSEGVPVDIADDAGYTLLMRSIAMDKLDLALWLIEQGATCNVTAPNGVSAAYILSFEMKTAILPGSEKERLARKIADLMVKQGVIFPPLSPDEAKLQSRS